MNNTSPTLKATITEFDQNGLMTVTFNKPIQVPQDYQTFNKSILNLQIQSGS